MEATRENKSLDQELQARDESVLIANLRIQPELI